MQQVKTFFAWRRFFMLLMCASLIVTNSCRKTINENNTGPSSKENISMDEVIQWGSNLNKNFAVPVNILYNKAQKTFYNNTFYIRVPVDSSTGYFYFIKNSKGLQPLFIRYHNKPGIWGDAWAEFIDFNTQKFYKALTFKNNKPVKQYSLSNVSEFFKLFARPANITTRAKVANNTQSVVATSNTDPPAPGDPNDCPLVDPASVLPLLSLDSNNPPQWSTVVGIITDLEVSALSGGPGTGCTDPNHISFNFWSWLGGVFNSIGDFFDGIFTGSNDNSNNNSTNNDNGNNNNNNDDTNNYPVILENAPSVPVNPNDPTVPSPGNQPNGPGNPTTPIWVPVDPNVSTPAGPNIEFPMANADTIKNDIQNPCLQNALSKITNNNLKSFISQLYSSTYSTTEINILFSEDPNLKDSDGTPLRASSTVNFSTQTWLTKFNPNFFNGTIGDSTSTEYTANIILHEIIHSFIFLYKSKYGITKLNEFTTHEYMFKNFIEEMKNTLTETFPSLSQNDALAIALDGLDDVLRKEYGPDGYALLTYSVEMNRLSITNYGISIPVADSIATLYATGKKGTRCQ